MSYMDCYGWCDGQHLAGKACDVNLGRLPDVEYELRLVGKPSQGWQGLIAGNALVGEELLPAFAAVLQANLPIIATTNQTYVGEHWLSLHTQWCSRNHPAMDPCDPKLLHTQDGTDFLLMVAKGELDRAYVQISPLRHWEDGFAAVEGSLVLGYDDLMVVNDILPNVIALLADQQANPGEQLVNGAHMLTSTPDGRTWMCSCDFLFTAITERHRLQHLLDDHVAEVEEVEARSRGAATGPALPCGCPADRVPQDHYHEMALHKRVSDPQGRAARIVVRAYWSGGSLTVYWWPFTPEGAATAQAICEKSDRVVRWSERDGRAGQFPVKFDELRRLAAGDW